MNLNEWHKLVFVDCRFRSVSSKTNSLIRFKCSKLNDQCSFNDCPLRVQGGLGTSKTSEITSQTTSDHPEHPFSADGTYKNLESGMSIRRVDKIDSFSDKQMRIYKMHLQGLTTSQMAKELKISRQRVSALLIKIKKKLGVDIKQEGVDNHKKLGGCVSDGTFVRLHNDTFWLGRDVE